MNKAQYIESPFAKVAYYNIGDTALYQRLFTDALEKHLRSKKGVDDLTKRLTRIADMSATRAKLIAQTERTKAQNSARWQSITEDNRTERAHQAKYRKMWVSHQDAHTRDSHAPMSGQVKYATEPFISGAGNALMYPGDPSAPASEVCNCRCYMRRVLPEEAGLYVGAKSSTISQDTYNAGSMLVEQIAKIDKNRVRKITESIDTERVVLLRERIEHIQQKHPGDYEAFGQYLQDVIQSPDFIMRDKKHPYTGIYVKYHHNADTGLRATIRYHVDGEIEGYANSVLTYQHIRDQEYRRLEKKEELIVYKAE